MAETCVVACDTPSSPFSRIAVMMAGNARYERDVWVYTPKRQDLVANADFKDALHNK